MSDSQSPSPSRSRSDTHGESSAPFRIALATLGLAIVELVATAGFGFRDFLSGGELWEATLAIVFASFAVASVSVGLVALVGLALGRLRVDVRERALGTGSFVAASLVVLPFLVELTSGRRVRDLPVRPVAVAVATVLAAVVVSRLIVVVRRGPSIRLAIVSLASVAVCAVADRHVLPHLYPAFHLLLAAVASFGSVIFGYSVPPRRLSRRATNRAFAVIVPGAFVAVGGLVAIAGAPNTSFVLEGRAVVTGKLVGFAGVLATRPIDDAPAVDIASSTTTAPGISLAGKDILLVTVDALRADRLTAYGGHGLAPAIDRLAEEGAVFRRAYTSTPHTSYALASLLTGKYLRPVFELPNASREHVTLPDRLRRYGYRTAAFYPPAIFFVDADRFSALEAEGFGFEYRKQMYAPAGDRVRQVESYLDDAPQGFPVFVWVHFFEPHEPYDPPRDLVQGEGDEALYDGEVRAVDAAVDALVRSFRARRPGATVILTADHGEEFQDHGGRYHGSTLYDEQVRVPFIWSSPGVVSHRVIDAPIEHVDLAATLLAATGMPRDVRMRGDDLGPLLAGTSTEGPRFAFADIAEQRMVVDGRYKAICETRSPRCQLFDLRDDPRERRNLASSDTATLVRLRGALSSFTASIPRFEAMALGDDSAFPPELARAELGDRTVGPDLITLLSSERAEVRAAAARFLGRLAFAEARDRLDAMASADSDENARAEAAIAAVTLGSDVHTADVAALVTTDDERGLLASLALGSRGNPVGAARLAACISNDRLEETKRHECVVAIGTASAHEAIPAVVSALDDVRLRPDAAVVLGRLGDRSVASALASHLAEERYVPSRLALAEALFRLGDRRFESATRRYLGMASGMPGGLGLLLEAGRLSRPGGRGGDLRSASIAGFSCNADGCNAATEGASLPTSATPHARLVVRVIADDDALVRIGTRTFGPLSAGPNELSVPVDGDTAANVRVRVDGGVRFVAYLIVPDVPEIPPPAPVPWDGGVATPSQ